MEPQLFWQNFELGVELDIAASFIYDGLKNLDEMENFHYETEIFHFLYYTSVGLERFLKVAIILTEYKESLDKDEFEKGLITHNHSELLNRLKLTNSINLGKQHIELVALLTAFYKTHRYDRYSINTIIDMSKEKNALVNFLTKYLDITPGPYLFDTIYDNDRRTKKFIGGLLSKIILQIFEIIKLRARQKNIYTYEIRYGSKAYKLLMGEQFDFFYEEILWKELLIFILNNENKSKYMDFLRELTPLEFDIALLGDYLQSFGSNIKKITITEELDHLFSELDDKKSRFEALSAIGFAASNFEPDEDEEIE